MEPEEEVKQLKQVEEEANEINCPICMQLLCVPMRIDKCKHIFCALCIETLFELDDRAKCPMCRSHIKKNKLIEMKELDEKLAKSHPQDHKVRRQIYDDWSSKRPIAFTFGNTAHAARGDYKKWKFFFTAVDGHQSDYIEKIVVNLHPTFTPNTETLTTAPFQITRLGWGVFNINFVVHWKEIFDKQVQQFNYYLSFAPETTNKVVKRIKPKVM